MGACTLTGTSQRHRQRRAVDVADGHRERVGRVVGPRLLRQAQQRLTMRATWSFWARPLPHTALLTCCGV